MEPAHLGLILDTSSIVAAERRGRSVRQFLEQIEASQGRTEIGVSVVSIAELEHGAYRANTPDLQRRRLAFIERLCTDIPVHPVSLPIARRAGRIQAQQKTKGIQVAFEDLLIGATALHLDYAVATLNLRHFQQIPGLSVVRF